MIQRFLRPTLLTLLPLVLLVGSAQAQNPPSNGLPAVHVASGWKARLYGFVEFDAVHDSTQSFPEASLNFPVLPRGTYQGDNARTQFTAKNSRIGLILEAPAFGSIRPSGQINFDFFGIQPTEVTENDYYVVGTMRLRHAYLKLASPVVDVLAGQHPTLFGWGGAGFYPATAAFLGTVGQVYHHDVQLRLSKQIGDRFVIEPAIAAVRPAQREAEIPDFEGGLRLAHQGRIGRTMQGNDRPETVPLSVGVSGMWRHFAVNEYRELPRQAKRTTGWGLAVNAFLPVIAASDNGDYSNCLTLTGEFSTGAGIADRYSGLTGGARFNALPNPSGTMIPPLYRPNIDNGLVTWDPDENLKPIHWQAYIVGGQYYLPFTAPRIWITGLYAHLESNNLADLTPVSDHGNIYTRADYIDGSLFVGVTPDVHFGIGLQLTEQTRGNGPQPKNTRVHFAGNLFF